MSKKKQKQGTRVQAKTPVRATAGRGVAAGVRGRRYAGSRGEPLGSVRKNNRRGVSLPAGQRADRADGTDGSVSGRYEPDSGESGRRARAWCFTVNNPIGVDAEQYRVEQPSDEMVFRTQDLVHLTGECEFFIVSLEMGTSGTPHFQGYLYLKGRGKTLNVLRRLCPRAHFAEAKGTAEQNVVYCSKSDTHVAGPWRLGVCPAQGRRTDLAQVVSLVADGATMRELAGIAPLVLLKYPRGIQLLHQLHASERPRRKTTMFYIWGPTGSGKSTECRVAFPDVFYKPIKGVKTGNEWWDGYDGHQTIIWDEFYGHIPWSLMLRLGDETTLGLEVKGGFAYCQAQYVIFLSNIPPEECFPNLFREDPRKFSALVRRLVCFHKPDFHKLESYDLRMKFGRQIIKTFDEQPYGIGRETLDLFQYNIFNSEELAILYDGRWSLKRAVRR